MKRFVEYFEARGAHIRTPLPVIRQEQDVKAGAEKALMPAADLEVTA
jgi:hypothetical protein